MKEDGWAVARPAIVADEDEGEGSYRRAGWVITIVALVAVTLNLLWRLVAWLA